MKRKPISIAFITFITLIALTPVIIPASPRTVYARGVWEFAGWYGGGCYPYIEFDRRVKNRIYLSSDVAGLWRSDDGGEHWRFINKGLRNLHVATVSVAPSDSRVVYAGTRGGLFVSEDSGESWKKRGGSANEVSFNRPSSYHSIAVMENDPDRLCIGTASGAVLCSDNRGASWRTLGGATAPFNDKKPVTALSFTKDSRYLLVASDKGVLRYAFAKGKWDIRNTNIQHVHDLVTSKSAPGTVYIAADKGILRSRDYGNTWNLIYKSGKGKITRISLFESIKSNYLAALWEDGWNGGALISMDGGSHWTNADQRMQADSAANPTMAWQGKGGRSTSIKFDPFDGSKLFRTDWWGVWKSVDNGNSWRQKIIGAPNTVVSDIFIDGPNHIYVATMDNGLLETRDGGHIYKALFPSAGYRQDINGHVWRVLAAGSAGNNIIATSSPWGEDINQFLISRNGGKSFDIVRAGLPKKRPRINTLWGLGYPRGLAVDSRNPGNVYLGIDGDDGGGLYISNNGGKTWRYSTGQPGSKKIYSGLAVDPLDSKRIFWGACGDKGGVYMSQDGGNTWRHVLKAMNWVFEIKVDNTGKVYAVGDQGGGTIYVSRDHGATWQLLKKFPNDGACKGFSVDPADSGRMAVSTVRWESAAGGKIYFSGDGGKSWLDMTHGLPENPGASATAFGKDGRSLYAGLYAGSVWKTSLPRSKPVRKNP